MSVLNRKARVAVGVAVALAAACGVRDARACGGCFHPPPGPHETVPSVITDHRMVFKVGPTETVLWDQIRYQGNPKEFAWVLPVRAGAVVQLSHDEWISALDAATQATVNGPSTICPSSFNGGGGGGSTEGGRGGMGCGAASEDSLSGAAPSGADEGIDGGSSTPEVQVVSQEVVGPYDAVIVHSNDGKGISGWLTDNGYDIPANVAPIIDAYTQEGFDFIALKLAPNEGVTAMQPIRVVTPGADATLPLRMVAAGVGAQVGVTLWVIGEGRYHTQNFPDAVPNWNALAWDATLNRSNTTELEANAIAATNGHGWITEAAITGANVTSLGIGSGAGATTVSDPPLYSAYEQQCISLGERQVPCDPSTLPGAPPTSAGDGGADAGDGDGGVGDGGDAGAAVPACTKPAFGCDGFDDYDLAMKGLHPSDVWVTRLRADLPLESLSTDLVLAASSDQTMLSPNRSTTKFTDPNFDPCAATRSKSTTNNAAPASPSGGESCACHTTRLRNDVGTSLLVAVTALVVSALTRRRRRR